MKFILIATWIKEKEGEPQAFPEFLYSFKRREREREKETDNDNVLSSSKRRKKNSWSPSADLSPMAYGKQNLRVDLELSHLALLKLLWLEYPSSLYVA